MVVFLKPMKFNTNAQKQRGMHVPGPLHSKRSGANTATVPNEWAMAKRVVNMLVKYDCSTFLALGMVPT